MRRMRRLFSGWAASFLAHTQHVAKQAAHGAQAAADRTGWQGRVSAGTRMRMTAPELYREARRNVMPRRRRRAVVGARRRVRLPSMVDTAEIGAWLYGDMRTISSGVRHGLAPWSLLARDGQEQEPRPFLFLFFPNPGFGRLPLALTLLG